MTIVENVLNFFISGAYADAPASATPAQAPSSTPMIMMLVVFVVFMYFAVWRPQNKRAKEQRNLLNSLNKGDEVMTAGGLIGRISKVNEQYVVLAVSDNTEIAIQKSSVISALPKGTLKTIV